MKAFLFFTTLLTSMMSYSQDFRQTPLINVSGEGKIKVSPDLALIFVSLESKGNNAVEVKKANDTKINSILKFIKNSGVLKEDFKTEQVYLSPNYDYEKKKNNYIASQTICITLKDLTRYESLMEGLVENGVNRIDRVEFKSSQMEKLQSDARKLAVKDAKKKAEDLVFELGQKVGKAVLLTDNSQNYFPQPVMYDVKMAFSEDVKSESNETIARGDIEIIVNVSVSFVLE